MRMSVQRIGILVGMAVMALLFAQCANDKGVAAKVNGKRIYIKEVEEMITRYSSLSKKLNPSYTVPTGLLLENMRRQFLEGLIDKQIILEKAKELKVSVPDSELVAKIQLLKKANEIVDEASFAGYLKEQGITEELFKNNIRDIMLMERTRDKFFSDVTVPDSLIQEYYKSHAAAFAREQMQAAHILVKMPAKEADTAKALKKAELAAKEARTGKDFTILAKKYSDDAGSKTGGELGLVNRGDMLPEIDRVLFELKKDSVAGPVKTKLGYHVLKALSDPKKEVRPLDDVKSDITDVLVLELRQAKLKAIRNNAKIKVLWDYKNLQ